ncbi:nuclear transport factor 2 family protein [Mesorhizobium sp. J428]|uniref:YybH family protein n=1 Tax=Mesorhizobium sp. J428 TaxID=2898440 RepID=UPI0021508CD1|nr:nuclear transport factor 2 family protein [Mesorhizobium sp. J428]MCR5855945.1 DUF4440 domain-containing protein [Mesorhizobium sp. J428]
MSSFAEFMDRREAAAEAYVRGRSDKVEAMASETEPSTFFGPDGKVLAGRSAIVESYQAGASRFGSDGESRLDVMQSAEGGDIAYWCGIQRAIVDLDGKAVPMNLRVTELFRRENGEWRLVHRHADFLRE